MTRRITHVLGHQDDPVFSERRRDPLPVAWDEAGKPRLRRTTTLGQDIAVDLGRGHYLADGDVLADDGDTIIVIERTSERALVVHLDPSAPIQHLLHDAVRLGHAFGNQHVPLEADGSTVVVPLTTSEDVARHTVQALGLHTATVTVEQVRLGSREPLPVGHTRPHTHPNNSPRLASSANGTGL